MVQGEQDGDDLSVNLSWPSDPSAAARPPPAPSPPGETIPDPELAVSPPGEDPSPRAAAPPGAPTPPSGSQVAGRPAASGTRQQAAAGPYGTGPPAPEQPRAARRPRRKEAVTEDGALPNETLVSVLDHLSTLSQLVTGTSRATSVELADLAGRVDRAVAEIDSLQQRVVRSLAGFDALRLRVQKEMADRPPLTDDDIERIADSVTLRLLDQVRVEAEDDRR